MTINILEYLDNAALRWPDKTALADDKNSLTFSEWKDLAQRLGSELAELTGKRMRSPIIVFTDRRIESLVGFMGVVESGNFYVPIDSRMPSERIRSICDILEPIAAVTISQKDEETLKSTGFEGVIVRYEEIACFQPDEKLLQIIREDIIDVDPVYSIFTSGSTGVPKGVIISHRGMIDLAEWLVTTFNFTEKDCLGNQTPFYFDGSIKDICICLKSGVTLNIITKKYFAFPKLIVPFLNERKITAILWATSAIMLIGNSHVLDDALPKYLRIVTFAGEAMAAKQLNVWIDKLPGVRFVNLYGPTEITVDCTYYEVNRRFADDEYIPIGRHCRNKQILVLNEANQSADIGETGELCVRGTGVSMGYYNNHLRTSEAFVQNPLNPFYNDIIYRTGDIVRINDNEELEFVSRKDFQIKHKGNRIELGEIEVSANALPHVTNVACIFDKENDKIVLFYSSDDNSEIDIINGIKAKVPAYMFPEKIYRLDQMPFNMNGKIDRIQLKKEYESRES